MARVGSGPCGAGHGIRIVADRAEEAIVALDRNLIAIIGRIHPAIYDVVFPHGVAELNPQPLPPRHVFAGIETGAAVGHELVRAAGLAKAFGLDFRMDLVEICPPPRPIPPLPWPFPWPPRPYPWRGIETEPEFDHGYGLGLGAVLEATAEVWQKLPGAAFLEELYGAAGELALAHGGGRHA